MLCPKCGHANPDCVQFCTQCHAPLRIKCPKCWHEQDHGGTCDQCGIDFAKYSNVYIAELIGENAREADHEEQRAENAASLPQIVAMSITSPWMALLLIGRYLFGRFFTE